MTLSDLLGVVSERSGLSRFAHRFDLPIANQDKVRLQQLKRSAITVVKKGKINIHYSIIDSFIEHKYSCIEGVSDGKTGLAELLTTEATDGGGVSPRVSIIIYYMHVYDVHIDVYYISIASYCMSYLSM